MLEELRQFRFEYFAHLAAERSEAEWQHQTGNADYGEPDEMSFYDFLLASGFSRFQLSAHGIGRSTFDDDEDAE